MLEIIKKANKEEIGQWVANYLVSKINQKPNIILGLPTGSTPIPTYQALIEIYKQKKVSFKKVTTFNMDEYIGLAPDNEQSYYYFMYQQLFNHIDANKENINILNGITHNKEQTCIDYENKIKLLGGLDIQIAGIGSNGHLAFNEPNSSFESVTREVFLTENTIKDNSRFFNNNLSLTPSSALSIGLGTIMAAKEVILIATGKNKANAVKTAFKKAISQDCPASILQNHSQVKVLCDLEAASSL